MYNFISQSKNSPQLTKGSHLQRTQRHNHLHGRVSSRPGIPFVFVFRWVNSSVELVKPKPLDHDRTFQEFVVNEDVSADGRQVQPLRATVHLLRTLAVSPSVRLRVLCLSEGVQEVPHHSHTFGVRGAGRLYFVCRK